MARLRNLTLEKHTSLILHFYLNICTCVHADEHTFTRALLDKMKTMPLQPACNQLNIQECDCGVR